MYLGAGLASLVIQALIGAAVALPILAAVYRKKLKSLFKRNKNVEEGQQKE